MGALVNRVVASSILCLLFLAGVSIAAPVEFVRDVRPILEKHCYECHGAKKQKGGFRLDVKSEAFKGGKSHAPDIVAGQSKASPLMQFVRGEDEDMRMPPKGERLSAAEIATLAAWIDQGAVWPDGVDLVKLEDKRDHWAFNPVKQTAAPDPRDTAWPRTEIDRFILARLEAEGLQPSAEADRVSLLRRAHFIVTGLPPSPEQVDAFSKDERPDAWERTVDELLKSPRYGERWAQHWLDLVRYADTHGFEVNTERPNAWPYRDYVIRALNDDTPYDRFIREQLAGDAAGEDAATGFLVTAAVLLPGQIGQDDASKRLARQDSLGEIVSGTAQTFLGLSVGCARCHDHKFDPIPQRDYYAMQAFFAGVEYGDRPIPDPLTDGARTQELAAIATNIEPLKKRLEAVQPPDGNADALTADAAEFFRLEKRKAELEKRPMVYAGTFIKPDVTRLLNRGDAEQPGEEILPAVLSVLGTLKLTAEAAEQERRVALASWIASPENPLAARVMVNRIWQGHFGLGLVETASDFGLSGTRPSHPELLDWLASEFIRSGWSMKHMHRLILTSATFRQSSRIDRTAQARDADCRLLWRFPARRLEAEAIRDSMLAVSGRLNLKMGGPGFNLFVSRGGLDGFPPVESFSGDGLRRMIYAHKVRMEREAVFGAFDCPDAGQPAARRRQSTTPIQALNLFNSRFTIEEAEAFAARVKNDASPNADAASQIRRAYHLAFGREPEPDEIRDVEPVLRDHGLPTLCRVLFNSNEFLFLP